MTELTSTQQQVLVLLANGRTTESAAKEVGADRNTVSDWRRTLPEFQKAFAIAQYEQTLYWREQLQQLGTLAIISSQSFRSALQRSRLSSLVKSSALVRCRRDVAPLNGTS